MENFQIASTRTTPRARCNAAPDGLRPFMSRKCRFRVLLLASVSLMGAIIVTRPCSRANAKIRNDSSGSAASFLPVQPFIYSLFLPMT